MQFRIVLGGEVFEIHTRFDRIRRKSEQYLTDAPADHIVEVGDAEIARFRDQMRTGGDALAEEYAIRDKINDLLLCENKATMHAAAVAVDGVGYLFCAPSGGGKSTHVMQWMKHFGDRARIINGDFPLLSVTEDGVFASGTPWCGKEQWSTNETVPVAGICFVVKSKQNRIRRLNAKEIIGKLFYQLILPGNDPALRQKCLSIADRLIRTLPFYELECDISEEAAITAYEEMRRNL